MTIPLRLAPLFLLCSCGVVGGYPSGPGRGGPELSGAMPMPGRYAEDSNAPNDTTLPIGIGLTTGPKTTLLGATLDFPLDDNVMAGPSLQYGFDDDTSILSVTGQIKYFLGATGDSKDSFSLLPYLTAGVGLATIDKDGGGSESGMLLNIGGGVRYLTGEHYRLASEARYNHLPDEVTGEDGFFSFELLQVVVSF